MTIQVEPWIDPTRWIEAAPWVTPGMAATIFNRSERTIREWIRRGDVTAMCLLHDGRLVVWWPDVLDMDSQAKRRRRMSAAAA